MFNFRQQNNSIQKNNTFCRYQFLSTTLKTPSEPLKAHKQRNSLKKLPKYLNLRRDNSETFCKTELSDAAIQTLYRVAEFRGPLHQKTSAYSAFCVLSSVAPANAKLHGPQLAGRETGIKRSRVHGCSPQVLHQWSGNRERRSLLARDSQTSQHANPTIRRG